MLEGMAAQVSSSWLQQWQKKPGKFLALSFEFDKVDGALEILPGVWMIPLVTSAPPNNCLFGKVPQDANFNDASKLAMRKLERVLADGLKLKLKEARNEQRKKAAVQLMDDNDLAYYPEDD